MNKCRTALNACLIACILSVSGGRADVRVDLLGQWGGTTYAVVIRDNLAYVGVGPRVVILDVSDPTNPVRVGQTEPLGHVVDDIVIDGALAYVSAHEAGLKIVDVSIPARPRLLSSYDLGNEALAIGKHGNEAFVFCEDAGLNIFDVTDATAPQPIAQYPFEHGLDMTMSGDIALVTTWGHLTLIDVRVPENPTFMSELLLRTLPWNVEVQGGYAYIAEDALVIADISDPYAPVLVSRTERDTWTEGRAVAVGQDRVYLIDDSPGVSVIDCGDHVQPVWRGEAPMNYAGSAVASVGTRVFTTDWFMGIRIIDASDADEPVEIGRYDEVAHIHFVTASGDLVFASGYRPGIQVLDVSDPEAPRRIAEWGDRRYSHVELHGTRAYLVDDGLQILDVSNLSKPLVLGELNFAESIGAIAVEGAFAYLCSYDSGLRIVDVSDPAEPRLVSVVDDAPALGIVVRDELAYVATYDYGLQVIDVSNPKAPVILGSAGGSGDAYCVTLVDDVAFVGGNGGVFLVDVSDPRNLEILPDPFTGYWGQVVQIAMHGRRVFVPAYPGLQVIDATNPRAPQVTVGYTDQGWSRGVAVTDDFVCLATGEGGVEILAIRPPGDLDGDGAVGIFDLTSLLSSFGTCAADAAYNRYADLDGDECVTVQDLASILAAFGG